MTDPVGLSASAVATLLAIKAFEKIGSNAGDSAWKTSKKFIGLLRDRFPDVAKLMERVSKEPDLASKESDSSSLQALIGKVEDIAKSDEEVRQEIQEIFERVNSQPTVHNINKLAEKIGFVVQGGNADFRQSNISF